MKGLSRKKSRKLKKVLDKAKEMWYNRQAVPPKREGRSERSLKIEQQERLYKALRSAKYEISSKELYILNKVREAKKE